MLKRLWLDEGGAVLSTELILLLVITVIGMVVGLTALRDAVDWSAWRCRRRDRCH